MNSAAASTSTTTKPKQATNSLGFFFDPVPDPVTADYAAGNLELLDLVVLGKVIRERRGDSSPGHLCTKERIAEGLGKRHHPRTIQRSFARLKERGWMDHVAVATPDPDDRTNATGYRVVFPKLTDGNAYAPGFRTYPRVSPGETSRVSPRETQPCPGGGDTAMSPLYSKDSERQFETTTDPSSSSFAPPTKDPELPPIIAEMLPAALEIDRPVASTQEVKDDPAVVADAVRQAEELFGPGMLKRVCEAIRTFTLAWVLAALFVARSRPGRKSGNKAVDSWGFVVVTLENWKEEGGPSPKVLAAMRPAPARADPGISRASPRPFDCEEQLGLLAGYGWTVAEDPTTGRLTPVRIREDATAWKAVPQEVKEPISDPRNASELRGYLQFWGKGARHGPV